MPFGLSRLFGNRRGSSAPSILTTTTANTHWNDSKKTYQHRTEVPMPATFEELSTNPELIALTIFHSMPYTTDSQRTASWMGEDDPQRAQILFEYLRLFNWDGENIVTAFRQLCSRIELKGESQYLDRIVDAFATRWINCNPHHKFVTHGVVYTVAYSIVLLNTDLHSNVDGSKTKMTQKQYVRYVQESINKMFAQERPPFSKVSDYRAYLESENPTVNSLINDNREYARSEWDAAFGGVLKLYYRSIAQHPLILPDGLLLSGGSRRLSEDSRSIRSGRRVNRRNSMASIGSDAVGNGSTHRNSELASQIETDEAGSAIIDQEEPDELRLLGPPWVKEGPLKFQYFTSVSTGMKKQHKQEWIDLFAMADRGQLRLYSLRGMDPRRTLTKKGDVGDGNWLNRAKLMYNFVLTHALAQNSDQNDNNGEWSLMLRDGRLLRFKTGTADIADEYVYTCNYWAARLSKPPQVEIISSTEYGWGRPVELLKDKTTLPHISAGSNNETIVIGDERIHIYNWSNQADNELHSGLPSKDQHALLREYVASIDAELESHSAALGTMLRVFTPKFAVSARAHANWEARSQFLLKETVQYTAYCTALERSVADKSKSHDHDVITEGAITPAMELNGASKINTASTADTTETAHSSLDSSEVNEKLRLGA